MWDSETKDLKEGAILLPAVASRGEDAAPAVAMERSVGQATEVQDGGRGRDAKLPAGALRLEPPKPQNVDVASTAPSAPRTQEKPRGDPGHALTVSVSPTESRPGVLDPVDPLLPPPEPVPSALGDDQTSGREERVVRPLPEIPEKSPLLALQRSTDLFPPQMVERSESLLEIHPPSAAPMDPAKIAGPLREGTSKFAVRAEDRHVVSRGATEPGSLEPVPAVSTFLPRIYELREKRRREEALQLGGGTEETERAVERGLRWLALHQSPNGRWSLLDYAKHLPRPSARDLTHPDWDGRGRNDSRGGSGRGENGDTAATGLAILAFLGHGDTHLQAGPYQENVKKGIAFLLSRQKRDGDLRDGGNLYMHGIATFALCEAYAVTRDRQLEEPCRRAVGYTIRSQNPDLGGWRYDPYPEGRDVDTSVFGWMLMGLKSARIAGIEVESRAVTRMYKYLQSARMSDGGGRYAYQPGLPRTSLAMVAQGLFSQQVLLEFRPPETEREMLRERRAAAESVGILLQARPEPKDQDGGNSYYWYYATLALFQEGGKPWETWNARLKQVLLKLQLPDDLGTAAGSWDPLDRRAQVGGRVYSTALCTLCLEVYYRYAPKDR